MYVSTSIAYRHVCSLGRLAGAAENLRFLAVEDLQHQVRYFVGRVEESLATKEGYDEAKQSRTLKDANTLAVLGLMLGKHDEPNPVKDSAAALIKN